SGALHRLVPSSGARLQSVLDQFKGATSALVSRDHCFAAANARRPSLKLGSTRTWPTEQDHSLRCGRCSLSLFWMSEEINEPRPWKMAAPHIGRVGKAFGRAHEGPAFPDKFAVAVPGALPSSIASICQRQDFNRARWSEPFAAHPGSTRCSWCATFLG